MSAFSTERRNVLIITGAQALFQTISVMVMTLSGLVGLLLASDKRLATLPIAMMTVATLATMIPASLLMQRIGRRMGFMLGASLGCAAGLLAAWAIWQDNFWLFTAANMLIGANQGFAQYYRFAAADAASPEFKSRAISWVMTGGVFAALVGPNLARMTPYLSATPYLAAYLAMTVLSVLALLLLLGLELPSLALTQTQGQARPLRQIMRQPVFLTALTGSAVSYGVMIMVMTATPLAMQLCGQPLSASTSVIQWHVLGMFVPSFFTGRLIQRFGVTPIMTTGVLLLGMHVLIALSGIEYLHFVSGLTLLGIGWNFLFIGATALLTESYQPAERAKTQAAHDFLTFGVVSLASLLAGGLLEARGWSFLNLTALPFLLLALLVVSAYSWRQRGY